MVRRKKRNNPSHIPEPQQANPQQPYVNPAFETEPGVQVPTSQTPVEQPTARARSPFEIQQREQQIASPGGTVNVGPSGQQVANPFQQPQATPVQQQTPQAYASPSAGPTTTVGFPGQQVTSPFQQPHTAPVQQPPTTQMVGMPQFSPAPSMFPQQFGPQAYAQGTTPQSPQFSSTPQITSPFQQQPSTEFGSPGIESGGMQARQPPMDIHDVGDELEIEIELPGVSKSDISLTGQANGLNLSAVETARETDDLVRSERGQRFFKREIPLGYEVDPKKVSAKFQNGILTISVPKQAAGQSTIEIK